MSTYFLHFRIKNYHHYNESPYYNSYDDNKHLSFYLVPLYIIVVAFPVLIASVFIYNSHERKTAGFLVSLHN